MPFLHTGSMPLKLDGSFSPNALQREFTEIGNWSTQTAGNGLVFVHHDQTLAIAVTTDLTEEGRHLPASRLDFTPTNALTFDHQLQGKFIQVNSVSTAPFLQNIQIATLLYSRLADHGFVVVSDTTQFETAQGLWKKLAKLPGYRVLVADVDNGYFRDINGEAITYNGSNIADADIWSSGSDFNGQYRVLILTRR